MENEAFRLTSVVAVARNGIIGRDNRLPWRLRADLRRFKAMTMGQPLVMGRRTFESIGRPLPGRQTIVLSRSGWTPPAGVTVARGWDDLPRLLGSKPRACVVGGAEIYRQAWPWVDQVWVTRVLADLEGDARWEWSPDATWRLASCEYVPSGPHDDWPTEFQVWTNVRSPSPSTRAG